MLLDQRSGASRGLALVTLAAFLSGCYKWVSPSEPIEQATVSGDETVKVWTSAGESVTLREARVEGEFLIGKQGARPDSVPLADIRRFEIEKHDTTGDVIVIGSIVGFAVLSIVAIEAAISP